MFALIHDFNMLAKEVKELRKEVEILNNTLGIYRKREAQLGSWMFMGYMGEEHGSKPIEGLHESVNLLKDHFGLEYVAAGATPAKLVKKSKKVKAEKC